MTLSLCSSKTSYFKKLSELELSLQQSLSVFKDLAKHMEELTIETEDYQKQLANQKEKCESKCCSGSESLKKVIASKDEIIRLVASALTKLYETKNLNILNEAFKILCGETTVLIPKLESTKREIKEEFKFPKTNILSPKKEVFNSIEDVSFKDESVSEIEGTPTGRTSPIIPSRKTRSGYSSNSSDFRDKKKCPVDWSTPEKKSVKLTYQTPLRSKGSGKLKQCRLNAIILKPNHVVDLTSSPELMTMHKNSQGDNKVQPLVKKESTDNDETILPSPTSGPANFPSLLKTANKNGTLQFKKPSLCLKSKSESKLLVDTKANLENSPVKNATNCVEDEVSINLLKPKRFLKALEEHSPIKMEPVDEDETHCDTIAASLSILHHVDILEQNQHYASPSKRPLAENNNIINLPPNTDNDASMSLLTGDAKLAKISPNEEKVKRRIPELEEPIYKEPTVRKKAEKRALPGWSCDECKNFYDELYQNDPEMLAKKMEECSKHRGRRNPVRPRTPEGFWNPRWNVPEDTEEFNKRNNAV